MTSKLEKQIELIFLLHLAEGRTELIEFYSEITDRPVYVILDGWPDYTIRCYRAEERYGRHEYCVPIKKSKEIISDIEKNNLDESQIYMIYGRDPFGLNNIDDDVILEIIKGIKKGIR